MEASRALIVGGAGMLGSQLARCAPDGVEVHTTVHSRLDVTRRDDVLARVRELEPSVIFNAAAYTAVDRAEREPEAAFAVNGIGAQNLALAARAVDARLVHVSTDFVFDGEKGTPYDEHDPPNPLGVYGRSKHWGECLARDIGADLQIVRTQWLYGPRGRHFVGAMIRRGREGGEVRVVKDQIGSPTSTLDLAPALWRIAREGAPGLYHCTNRGSCSWFDFAESIFAELGWKVALVPITSQELDREAPRPTNSTLGNLHLELGLGVRMRRWQDALHDYLSNAEHLAELEEALRS